MSEEKVIIDIEPKRTSVWAVVSLIMGIGSHVGFGFFGAVIALITGYVAKNEISEGNGLIEGERLASAGVILGWVGLGLSILVVCLAFAVFLGLAGTAVFGLFSFLGQ